MESLNAMKASRDRQAEAKAQAEAAPSNQKDPSPRSRPDIEDAPPPPVAKTPARPARQDEDRYKDAGLASDPQSSDDEAQRDVASRRSRLERAGGSPGDVGYDMETESFEASAEEVLSMQVRPKQYSTTFNNATCNTTCF